MNKKENKKKGRKREEKEYLAYLKNKEQKGLYEWQVLIASMHLRWRYIITNGRGSSDIGEVKLSERNARRCFLIFLFFTIWLHPKGQKQ